MQNKDKVKKIFSNPGQGVGYNAMLLAITRTLEDENLVKQALKDAGLRYVVTEIGGQTNGDFQQKIKRAIIGASLNEKVIDNSPNEVHALLHAMVEAKKGVLVNMSTSANLALKMAVVRDEHWIAVALFGESSIYPLTNHERCGLGVMHI